MPTPAYNPATDPATMSGARQDKNYIGATNFANLQKQYTPYQIEQATERRGNDIFWKSGVNIADVPTIAPSTAFQPPVEKPPIPAAVVGTPTPVITSANPSNAEFDARNKAAASYLTGMQSTIDSIQAQQEARLADQKAAQEGVVKGLKDKLTAFMGGNDYQTSLEKDRELFNTKQKIQDLSDIQTKIADAQNALNQGLIYEEGRPTRMELLTGRSAELKKQGLAQVQALQSTAEIIKGNIDLARAYAQDSIDAIKMDNDKKIGALNTLLDLENKSLVSISDEEKATIKERMNTLQGEADRVAKEKDQLFDLATKYPQAFSKGGVTFRDSLDDATKKMLPYLGQQQQLELDKARLGNELISSQIKENIAQAAKASGSGSDGKVSEIASYMEWLVEQGANEQEVRTNVYKKFGDQFKKQTDLSGIVDNIIQGAPEATTPEQQQKERVLKMRQDLETKGILELDASTGKYYDSGNADEIKKAQSAGVIEWNGTNWVDKAKGTAITDPSKITYNDSGFWTVRDTLRY